MSSGQTSKQIFHETVITVVIGTNQITKIKWHYRGIIQFSMASLSAHEADVAKVVCFTSS